ncbi:hypothetical protein IFM89_029205 [Coptis chinensis]|uniref:Uncharacterized protein n=1 Tax=Coptis chinensis TaxID=261450 RepID=A0A835M7D3_9MAGN|nr:hypothetical protein IFM89_029205 [Coptis chinensis]
MLWENREVETLTKVREAKGGLLFADAIKIEDSECSSPVQIMVTSLTSGQWGLSTQRSGGRLASLSVGEHGDQTPTPKSLALRAEIKCTNLTKCSKKGGYCFPVIFELDI